MTLWNIICQETALLFRSKRPIGLLLLAIPLLYTLLFGLAYSNHVIKATPTLIYDQDQTTASRTVTQAFADSEKFAIVGFVTSQEDVEAGLRDNLALAAITIPPHFQQNIKLGQTSAVLVTANGTNVSFANTVITASQEIVQTLSVGTGQKLLEAVNQQPAMALKTAAPVKLGIRILHNPVTSYSNFMLTGLAINGLQIAILLVAGPTLLRELSCQSKFANSPAWTIVLGKLLPVWAAATLVFLLAVGLSVTLFAVPFRGSILDLTILGSAFCFFVTSACLFFSTIAKTEVDSLQQPLLYFMPGLLFSGVSWPQFAMNDLSRQLAALMPLTYTADCLRDILLAGNAPSLLYNTLIMTGAGLGLSLAATALFAWRRRKATGSKEATA